MVVLLNGGFRREVWASSVAWEVFVDIAREIPFHFSSTKASEHAASSSPSLPARDQLVGSSTSSRVSPSGVLNWGVGSNVARAALGQFAHVRAYMTFDDQTLRATSPSFMLLCCDLLTAHSPSKLLLLEHMLKSTATTLDVTI